MRGLRPLGCLAFFAACALAEGRAVAQQNLGHKVLGTLGLDAGSQPGPGLYVSDRALWYRADQLMDRHGRELAVGLDLDALGNGFGVAGVLKLPLADTFLTVSMGVPLARVRLTTTRPEASIDRFGLADLYVQPLKLGWRRPRFDVVVGYGFYAPTAPSEPGGNGGVGRGHWTHEFSLGGTVAFDGARTWRLSALASYDLNLRKRGIDLTRGDTVQVQGGFGKTLGRVVDVGLCAWAQWQVRDDSGTALPAVLAGARDRSFGLGPEVGLLLASIRTRVMVRYAHDFAVTARPQGHLLVVGLTVAAWRPDGP